MATRRLQLRPQMPSEIHYCASKAHITNMKRDGQVKMLRERQERRILIKLQQR
jgi:hypothetical protein